MEFIFKKHLIFYFILFRNKNKWFGLLNFYMDLFYEIFGVPTIIFQLWSKINLV